MKRVYRLTPRGNRRAADLFYADLVGSRAQRRQRAAPLSRYPAAPVPSGTRARDDGEALDVPAAALDTAYAPPDVRPFTRNTSASLFRTPPDPVAVADATQWPQPTTDADDASEHALRELGVSSDAIAAFSGAGMTALRPIASVFGEASLIELLRRLRYSPARLARPPHSYDSDADLRRAFGRPVPRPVILAIRTLLAIPGHFREIARLAGTDKEAFALENLGWLLMQSVGAEVRSSCRLDFWLPSSPSFVTAFPPAVSGLSPQVTQLIASSSLADGTIAPATYRGRFRSWQSGAAGRIWRLETGRDTSPPRAPGAPFYTDPFTIPASITITPERAQVNAAWRRRVADFDAGRTTVPLSQCDDAYLAPLGLMSARISLRGLQLQAHFPAVSSAPSLSRMTGLAAVRPVFEAAFHAIAQLGWNDLLFETKGMGCFRGKRIPGNPTAARQMSEHALGIAIDLNAFENGQNIAGAMDPRIVALFEAFGFRWGKGFPTPDPMHFEYAG